MKIDPASLCFSVSDLIKKKHYFYFDKDEALHRKKVFMPLNLNVCTRLAWCSVDLFFQLDPILR